MPAHTLVRAARWAALRHAALVEPTAVAVHDVRRAGLRDGETALVVGGGPIGVLIALVARRTGADVLLVEPDAYRRGVAERLGTTAPWTRSRSDVRARRRGLDRGRRRATSPSRCPARPPA